MRIASIAISALLTAFVGTTLAQSAETPRADKRQAKQDARIEKGKTSGALNDKEAARLEAGQARVDAKEAAAKADGTVTKKEKVAIEKSQDRQSRRIARQKHDAQTKPAPAPAQ